MNKQERNEKQAAKMRNHEMTDAASAASKREAAADAEMIRDTVAEAQRRGVSVATVIRSRRAS